MTRVTQLIHDAGKYLLISVYPLPTHPTHNFTHKNGGNLETLPGWPKKLQHNRPARSAGQWRHGKCGTQQMVCQIWFIFTQPRHTKISSSATLKGIMLHYPTACRDHPLRNTLSTGKLKNMKFNLRLLYSSLRFKASQFWGEKRPANNSEDRIPTLLGPTTATPTIPRKTINVVAKIEKFGQ